MDPNLNQASEIPEIRPLQVYSRKNKNITTNQEMGPFSLKHGQSSVPKVSPDSNTSIEELNCLIETNQDLPIEVQKGVQKCTMHPIANFLSYQKLNSEYKTFAATLVSENVPKNIKDALKEPRWKETIMKR